MLSSRDPTDVVDKLLEAWIRLQPESAKLTLCLRRFMSLMNGRPSMFLIGEYFIDYSRWLITTEEVS